MMNPVIISEKESEFAKGVYVSGFERSLTVEMLMKHFNIKPILAMKLPLTKHQENKGFAFIYYHSPDDANYVKQTLDHSVILINKIRVTKTVNAEQLSKMMFKLRTQDKPEAEIKLIKEKFFNEKRLEEEVSKIIQEKYQFSVEVNKILIPHQKINSKAVEPLSYARGFFYISDIEEAFKRVATALPPQNEGNPAQKINLKKKYDDVLKDISEILNSHPEFSKVVTA